MDRTKFVVVVVALLLAWLGFFYLLSVSVRDGNQSDLNRQKDCVSNGLEYVYDAQTDHYNCLYGTP